MINACLHQYTIDEVMTRMRDSARTFHKQHNRKHLYSKFISGCSQASLKLNEEGVFDLLEKDKSYESYFTICLWMLLKHQELIDRSHSMSRVVNNNVSIEMEIKNIKMPAKEKHFMNVLMLQLSEHLDRLDKILEIESSNKHRYVSMMPAL